MNPADVIGWHHENYQQRILNRNPLLHYYAGKSALRIDLLSLFIKPRQAAALNSSTSKETASVAGSPFSLLMNLLSDISKEAPPRREVRCQTEAVSAKLEKIKINAEDVCHATGQHASFIGFPVVVTHSLNQAKKSPIVAPAFLLPITLKVKNQSVEIAVAGDVRANPFLSRWLQVECNIESDLVSAADHINAELSDASPTELIQIVQEALKDAMIHWADLEGKNGLIQELSPAPTKEYADRKRSENQSLIVWSAICGVAEFRGQALNDDLLKLKEIFSGGGNGEGGLRYFINDHTPFDMPAARAPIERDKFLICASDPSQESVIWQRRETPIIVVQGPPGTGKSQTIVNMISDALAQNKTVAVFCEKRAALDVIQKRMGKLQELCSLIDDPKKRDLIKYLDDVTDWRDRDFGERDRMKLANEIERWEGDAENFLHPIYRPASKALRFADLKSRTETLHKVCPEYRNSSSDIRLELRRKVTKIFDDVRYKAFKDKSHELEAHAKQAAELLFGESPWRFFESNAAFSREFVSELIQDIKSFMLLKDAHYSSIEGNKWLAASNYLGEHATSFISADLTAAYLCYQRASRSVTQLQKLLPKWDLIRPREALLEQKHRPLLDRMHDDATAHLPTANQVIGLKKQAQNSDIGGFLIEHFSESADRWHEIVELAWCEDQLHKLEQEHGDLLASAVPAKTAINTLRNSLEEKAKADVSWLREQHRHREPHREILKTRGLLRLRGSKRNGTRKTEIRDLYTADGSAEHLGKLKPVLLARPEVACAILPLKAGLFDLVILDEASQMFLAEAMPLLHRGKQIVIAGDKQQMPPSDFFSHHLGDEEEDDVALGGDTNAIEIVPPGAGELVLLDAAENLATGQANKRLNVHYRSSFRELIEFSNQAFYESGLQAAPGNPAQRSPLARPILYESVAGEFSSGVNAKEAHRIVEWLGKLFVEAPDYSIGVIVMNTKQKDLVEELLQVRASKDEKFAQLWEEKRRQVSGDEDVGLFIRSVERVQGDERDIIIFAATYSGVSNSFGPLTDSGKGRKRLNVAITRAKQGMIVLSSLTLDSGRFPFDMSKDGSYLRQYLRYAKAINDADEEARKRTLADITTKRQFVDDDRYDSPFEEEVCEFLRRNGYEVETQIGEGGFRIDLGVRCARGGYLCGIECDGAQYHSGWRARANDIWRQEILESKGWTIIRIWSTDWFNSPEVTKQKLLVDLSSLVQKSELHEETSNITVPPPEFSIEENSATLQLNIDTADKVKAAPRAEPFPELPRPACAEVGDTVTYVETGTPEAPRQVLLAYGKSEPNIDSERGILRVSTPLGKEILGKEEGDEFELFTSLKHIYRILKIEKG